ncbi:MAG: YihY/virulence factor BrkB family protein [Clostridia bacterium]|nr:YihY/virulence factor BrkB family protein [Clostridia bacterium]
MKKKVNRIISYLIYQFRDPYYQGAAPQLAFFLFLSIFPIIVLLTELLSLFQLTIEDIQLWANIHISGEGTVMIENFLSYKPSGMNMIFLIIMALWGGSRVQFSLSRITNYTFSDGKITGKGWFFDRLRAVIVTAIVIFSLVLALVLLVYAPAFIKLLMGENIATRILDSTLMLLRWPLVLALYFLMISYIYFVLPQRMVPYKDILPGTALTAVMLLASTALFNLYFRHNVTGNILYGSLSSIFALMLWLWLVATVFIIGIIFNRVWWIVRTKNPVPLDKTALERRIPLPHNRFFNKIRDNIKE